MSAHIVQGAVAKRVAIAQKVTTTLKNPTWNVPNEIPLAPCAELVLGRCPGKSKGNNKAVILHSPKLPSMLSRRHALIKYDTKLKQWTVTDLKSLNGVYVGDERVKPDVAVPLVHGDRVCFGVDMDTNDFKYELVCKGSSTIAAAVLRRCGTTDSLDETLKCSPSPSPPLVKGKRGLGEDQRASLPKKKPRLSEEREKTKSRHSLERDCVISTPEKEPKVIDLSVVTSGTPKSSPALSVPLSAKPSPALSISSTKSATSDIDELFIGEEVESTAIMDEAIFGEASGNKSSRRSKVFEERRGMDATSLQIQLAKEQMDKEKHKLLSSIEALRSELAAKDQLLAEKDEKAKTAENIGNSVVSSMQEEFTCVICQELFINAYTLPCAHSFCEWCIKEWMKRKGHKDCPICRKKISSDPVHSLALDNAVSKLVEKLNPDEQKERKETETEHKNALAGLEKPKAVPVSSSRMTTRSSAASPRVPSVVIHVDESGRVTTRSTAPDRPIILDTSTESDSDSDSDEEADLGEDSDDSDTYDSGVAGAYYGGYGRCFNCGRRGHWAPGCPY